jgi:ribonuclease G
MTTECPDCRGTGRVFTPEVVARRLERSVRRCALEKREKQVTVRLHPEVAIYLREEEPKLIGTLARATGIEIELRDDPTMHADEFRLMSRPSGRDLTPAYAVA